MPNHPHHAATQAEHNRVEVFQTAWRAYRLLVEADAADHAKVGEVLSSLVDQSDIGRRRFIDLACGDAETTTRVLLSHRPRGYLGIDLSSEALSNAEANLEQLREAGVPVQTRQADFVSAAATLDASDAGPTFGSIGLSLHHYDAAHATEILRDLRAHLHGPLVIAEPVLRGGETYASWADRLLARFARMTGDTMDPEAWASIESHVRNDDIPRSGDQWRVEAAQAGWDAFEPIELLADDCFCIMQLNR